jgi:SAM-dependent methyltransferase
VPEDYFGEEIAERYDETSVDMFDPAVVEPAVAFLADLAGSGAALELGIGTGRIALPLVQRGVRVHGIDLSEAMVARMRAKPGGERIPVTIGDFATTTVDETFTLTYLVFNTIVNLTTQDEQVACFQNAAAHLEPGGAFVIEVGVPSLRRLPPRETVNIAAFSEGYHCVNEFDVANQGLVSHHFTAVGGAFEERSIPFRYVWPSELDLMARLAGMRLRDRWSGWAREPFTSDSTRHVSVWEKPAPP